LMASQAPDGSGDVYRNVRSFEGIGQAVVTAAIQPTVRTVAAPAKCAR